MPHSDDDKLIIEHEVQLKTLKKQGEERRTILQEVVKKLNLFQAELGIKDYRNGERDRRIQTIGDRTEEEDKSIREEIQEIKINQTQTNLELVEIKEIRKELKDVINSQETSNLELATIKGLLQGQDKRETHFWNKKSIKFAKWGFIAMLIIAVLTVVFSLPSINGFHASTWLYPLAHFFGFV
jgi:hypothetical protein